MPNDPWAATIEAWEKLRNPGKKAELAPVARGAEGNALLGASLGKRAASRRNGADSAHSASSGRDHCGTAPGGYAHRSAS